MSLSWLRDSKQLISSTYLLYVFGFGPLYSLVIFWTFRRDYFRSRQALQSAILQFIPSILESMYLVLASWLSYISSQPIASSDSVSTMPWLWYLVVLSPRTIFLIMAIRCSLGQFPKVSVLWGLAGRLRNLWLKNRKIWKGQVLNIFCPGLGYLYWGQKFLASIFFIAFAFSLCIFVYFVLAHFDLPSTKDALGVLGFYLRLDDNTLLEERFLFMSGLGLCLAYFLPLISRSYNKMRISANKRIAGSLGASYSLVIILLCCLFMVPYVFQQSRIKQASEHHLPKEIEINFELLSEEQEIDQLNGFSLQSSKHPQEKKHLIDKLSDKLKHSSKQDTEYPKSYSQYISAKIREGGRDDLIWQAAGDKVYSLVLQYTVEASGHISSITILDPSQYPDIDRLAIEVTRSMSPMLSPPRGETLRITELFWNMRVSDIDMLNTELKRYLASRHLDGRYIQKLR